MASSAEAQRFLAYVGNMPEGAQPFIRREFREVHPEAFGESYSLWIWWPLEDLRLGSRFDERRYFQLVHEHIVGAATREGETRAISATNSLASYYGVPREIMGNPDPAVSPAP